MKNFIKKNFMFIIIAVVLVLFVVLSLLIKDKEKEISDEIKAWIESTKTEELIVNVIAQKECYYCNLFKPTMDEVHSEYNFKLNWFEIDVIKKQNVKDYNAILETYDLTGYQGTPYTFITKNGELVDYLSGNRDKETLLEFLQTNGVITLND